MAATHLPPSLRAVSFEADQAAQVLADPDVVVVPIVGVHGAAVPGGKVVVEGVRWCRPGACQACFAPFRWCWDPSGSPLWRSGPDPLPPCRLTDNVAGSRQHAWVPRLVVVAPVVLVYGRTRALYQRSPVAGGIWVPSEQ
jgi:hypothetical protein